MKWLRAHLKKVTLLIAMLTLSWGALTSCKTRTHNEGISQASSARSEQSQGAKPVKLWSRVSVGGVVKWVVSGSLLLPVFVTQVYGPMFYHMGDVTAFEKNIDAIYRDLSENQTLRQRLDEETATHLADVPGSFIEVYVNEHNAIVKIERAEEGIFTTVRQNVKEPGWMGFVRQFSFPMALSGASILFARGAMKAIFNGNMKQAENLDVPRPNPTGEYGLTTRLVAPQLESESLDPELLRFFADLVKTPTKKPKFSFDAVPLLQGNSKPESLEFLKSRAPLKDNPELLEAYAFYRTKKPQSNEEKPQLTAESILNSALGFVTFKQIGSGNTSPSEPDYTIQVLKAGNQKVENGAAEIVLQLEDDTRNRDTYTAAVHLAQLGQNTAVGTEHKNFKAVVSRLKRSFQLKDEEARLLAHTVQSTIAQFMRNQKSSPGEATSL